MHGEATRQAVGSVKPPVALATSPIAIAGFFTFSKDKTPTSRKDAEA